jgi:hypothetical protein
MSYCSDDNPSSLYQLSQHETTVTLTWKKRYPKRERSKVMTAVQSIYPNATDTGEAVQIRTYKDDTKPVWMFVLWKCFGGIE